MKNMTITIISVFILNTSLYSVEVINTSQKKIPDWVKNTPEGKHYTYYKGIGISDKSLSDAKKIAISDAISTIAMQDTSIIESKTFTSLSENTIRNGRNINAKIRDSVVSEVLVKGKSSYITGLGIEEEYWHTRKSEKGIECEYWILMKVPKSEYKDLKIPIIKGYGFSPIWRSMLIPGWGQFYKGESHKGWRFLISETVLVPTTFISMYFSQNYHNKAENERDYDKRKFYNDWSNRSYTIGTVSGIVAGAIYVYNVFDSITAKGAKKYAGINSRPVELSSMINSENISVKMTINF